MITKTVLHCTNSDVYVESTRSVAQVKTDLQTAKANGTTLMINEVDMGSVEINPDNVVSIREQDWGVA